MAISHVNTTSAGNSGNTVTVNKPSGTSDGDTLILWLVLSTEQDPSFAGWTKIGGGGTYGLIYKKTASSEPSSWTFETDSVLDGFSLAVVSAWSGVGNVTAAYSQAGASGGKALIADPGTLEGVAVLGLSTRYFSSYMGDLQSDTWTPTMTLRGTGSDGDRDAIITSVAVAGPLSPGTLWMDATNGVGQRGYVVLSESGTIERDGLAGLLLGCSSDTDQPEESGSAGLSLGASSVTSEGATRTGSTGIALGCSSVAEEPEYRETSSGVALGCSSEFTYENPTEAAASLSIGATSDAQDGDPNAVTAGVEIGCSAQYFAGQKCSAGISLGCNSGQESNRNLIELRKLVASRGARLLGSPATVSYTALSTAKRVLG